MNTGRIARLLGQMLPDFFGGEDEDRREEANESAGDFVDGGLGGAASFAARRLGVKAIFQYVEVECAEVHDAKIVDGVIDAVEFIGLAPVAAFLDEFGGGLKHPANELFQFACRKHIARRMEITHVDEREAEGVANFAIGFGELGHDALGHAHIRLILHRSDPEAEEVRAPSLADFVGLDSVAEGFGHCAALLIKRPAVPDHCFVRRLILDSDRDEQGTLRPSDVYTEGPDQYRGWFQSSLLVAVGIKDQAPYKTVVGHGWTLDEQGRAMSKSLGNAIEPNEICERWGADLLRLWVASVEYQSDVRMSERVMTQLSEAYRKIRNTFRFALINVSDFDPSRDALPAGEMEELDRWMLERAAELVKKCRDWCEAYEFHRVYHAIHDFCVVDLSAFYFDVLKDRLYTKAPRSRSRRSAQTVVWKITSALVRLIAPILVFTAEEIWRYLPKAQGEPESVHMALFPEADSLACGIAGDAAEKWARLAQVRSAVLVALEQARAAKTIGGGLEAKVRLHAAAEAADLQKLLEEKQSVLPALFIDSRVSLEPRSLAASVPSETLPGLELRIERAHGRQCERCGG